MVTEWCDLVREIDGWHSVFLGEIGEPTDNSLRLVLHEGSVSPEIVSREIGGTILEGHRVQVTRDSRVMKLTWSRYIAYSVTNESYARGEGTEVPDSGRFLRRYSDSSFLSHVSRSTVATQEYPGHYQHFQVAYENHIVDVVSMEMPVIKS